MLKFNLTSCIAHRFLGVERIGGICLDVHKTCHVLGHRELEFDHLFIRSKVNTRICLAVCSQIRDWEEQYRYDILRTAISTANSVEETSGYSSAHLFESSMVSLISLS